MKQNYHMTMSGGITSLSMEADSAAHAIGLALVANPGFIVTSCWAGGRSGRIEFEIPKHSPHVPPPSVKRSRRVPCQLFDDEQIKAESKLALAKR